jgi:hypothetical protein
MAVAMAANGAAKIWSNPGTINRPTSRLRKLKDGARPTQ